MGDGTLPNVEGARPWIGDGPSTPNEAYFARADRVVEAAGEMGLVLVLGVFHQLQRSAITEANARPYARWISRRWAETPNIVWSMYPAAEAEYVPVLRELAAGLREGDGGAHLVTVHPDPSPASSSFVHEEDWLSFNSIQTWLHYELVHPMVAADYARTPPKPVVMAEGGYEGAQCGAVHTPHLIRKQAYWTCLAGGYHSYGHNDNWAAPADWRSWVHSLGAHHMGVCGRVLTGLDGWWGLVPDQSLFVRGAGSGVMLNAAARSAAGDWALAYLCTSDEARIDMAKVTSGAMVDAAWIDPTSGARTPIGSFPTAGERAFAIPEGWEDALLLFERPEEPPGSSEAGPAA